MTEKERRKAIKKELKNLEKINLLNSLPISAPKLQELFDWLDLHLSEKDCDDSLKLTKKFIEDNHLPENALIEWLNKSGGFCDCEVLANVENEINDQ